MTDQRTKNIWMHGAAIGASLTLLASAIPLAFRSSEKIRQEGIEQGRAEAISWAGSTVDRLTKQSIHELHLRSAGTTANGALLYQEKAASLDVYFYGVRQIQNIDGKFARAGIEYITGKTTVESNVSTNTPNFEIKKTKFEEYALRWIQ